MKAAEYAAVGARMDLAEMQAKENRRAEEADAAKAAAPDVIGNLIADVQGRCTNTHTWIGQGRQRHSSRQNITSRCILVEGHAGGCLMERQKMERIVHPALPAVPATRVEWYVVFGSQGGIETLNGNGEPLTFLQATERAKRIRGTVKSRQVPR